MLTPISVSIQSLNIETIAPVLVTLAGGLFILIIDLFKKDLNKSLYVVISLLFLLMSLGFLIDLSMFFASNGTFTGIFNLIVVDGISLLAQIIIVGASLLFIPLALTSKRFHEFSYPEFFALFLFMIAGFMIIVSTDNLILIFLGLETASLSLYTLIALHNRSKSFEAAVKYFTMGALAAGLYVFGAMVLYALTGSVEIHQIASILVANHYVNLAYVLVGIVFLFAALAFKVAIIPFHTWAPDVYEGASASMAGYMSIVPKIAGFVVMVRLFEFLVQSGLPWIEVILYASVVITMTASNIWALVQTDVKRMLAYSSISHAGFVLSAILIGTTQANTALFLYWVLFTFTNLGAFSMLWISRQKNPHIWRSSDHPYEKFSGMIHTSPVAAVIMGIFMLSLAGVPPFALFWGKMYMISSAVTSGFTVLAVIMVLNSAIAAFYYLKLIVYMFMKEPVHDVHGKIYTMNTSKALSTVIGIAAIVTIFAFVVINPLLEIIASFVYNSGF